MRKIDQFFAVMDYADFDHPPLFDEPVWPQTLARWRREGLPQGASWEKHLGVEKLGFYWLGFNQLCYPPFEKRVIEDTPEHRIYIDEWGRTVRDLKNSMSMPEWIDLPVKDRASFERMLERLEPNYERRMPADWEARVAKVNSPDFDALICVPTGNYFFNLDAFMGVETVGYMLYDCPDLVHRYCDLVCDLCCWFLKEKVIPRLRGVRCLGTGEDLAYKTGPLLSPAMFEEFFVPRYRRVVAIGKPAGFDHYFVDSDGNFDILLPRMLEIGMDIFCPVEVAAGMDPVALRARHGRGLRMVGGVDKRLVAAGKDAIDAELERLFPLMCEGGFVPKIDHSVSSDISWDNFRHYIDKLRELHARCASR